MEDPEQVLVNIVNNFATKTCGFWYLSMVENTRALRSIRMEGMRCFASKSKGFCMQKERMDGKLSQTELSSLKIYYLSLTLRVAFPIIKFLDLGSNAKIKAFPNLETFANSCCYINVRVFGEISLKSM